MMSFRNTNVVWNTLENTVYYQDSEPTISLPEAGLFWITTSPSGSWAVSAITNGSVIWNEIPDENTYTYSS